MQHKKKMVVMLSFVAFIIMGMAASKPPVVIQVTGSRALPNDTVKRNLKVLPQNISDKALDSIMESYEKALGIKCDFCHVKAKNDPEQWDYVSDERPEKEIARNMMRMTSDINRKYFHFNEEVSADLVQAVTCKTCHRGEPHPEVD